MAVKARMPFTQIAPEALGPRLSVLGFVKVGGKEQKVRYSKKSGRPWAAPVRYVSPARFEVTTRTKRIEQVEGRGKAKGQTFTVDLGYERDEEYHTKIGDPNPTVLHIRLMFPSMADNFDCYFAAHSGTDFVCQGNGIAALDAHRGEVPCPCPRLKQFEGEYKGPNPNDKIPCKPKGELSVILPDAETYGGFHVFKTTSWESIANIRTQLSLFERQFGSLLGLPLQLKVMDVLKSYDEGMTTQPIVTVVVPASFETARQIAAQAIEQDRKLLSGIVEGYTPEIHREVLVREMQEEMESEAGEFYPETGEGYREEQDLPPIVDAEIVDGEDEGGDEGEEGTDSEAICRDILDLAGWEKVKINRQIAKSASEDAGLEGLLEKLKKALPKEYQEVMVVWHSVQADDEEEGEEAGSEEPAAEDSDEQEELF